MLQSRIALDVMGGDHAPDAILRGALAACSPLGKHRIAPERLLLVGDEPTIRAKLAGWMPAPASRSVTRPR
jgi:fatty acid/phospholipid biosynthesis enzyme